MGEGKKEEEEEKKVHIGGPRQFNLHKKENGEGGSLILSICFLFMTVCPGPRNITTNNRLKMSFFQS
jgi:hypothetical protein